MASGDDGGMDAVSAVNETRFSIAEKIHYQAKLHEVQLFYSMCFILVGLRYKFFFK